MKCIDSARLAGLAILALGCSTNASAQERWHSKLAPLSLEMPAGWTSGPDSFPAGSETFMPAPATPGSMAGDACTIKTLAAPKQADGKPLTQAEINADPRPFPIAQWLTTFPTLGMEFQDSVETFAPFQVDGVTVREAVASGPKVGKNTYLLVGNVVTAGAIYSLSCIRPTALEPRVEDDATRDRVTREFRAILDSIDLD